MRHNFFFSTLLIALCCNLSAQSNISPIEKYLLLKQKSRSPDQLFIHLDRNKYKPGDTVYFQAYIRDRFTNEFESKSVSLYALIFDDNRAKVDSSRFKIDNSTCSGWMSIPLKAKSGKYHFAAFTSIMQNFDPSEAFLSDILVKGPDKIIEENDASFKSEYFELKFLPEGGNSVLGLKQRIGFNATDGKGYPVHIEGLLKNSSGSTLDTIKSGDYGPGLFVCTPEPGMYLEITKGTNKEKIWKLPNPLASGICMSVKTIDKRSFSIEIQSNNYDNDTLTVEGVMNTSQVFLQNLILNKKQRVVIETDQLPSGVAQITIFNKELHPLAERLYYVNSDKRLIFKIDPGSHIYAPGQETELTISVNDSLGNHSKGIFSISVADSISGCASDIYTPGIESVFNYNPYFQRNLPKKVLVTGLENLTNEERDLMLMIYGWSRYSWNFTDKETFVKDLINYDLINIKVLGESKVHPSTKKLDLISLEGPSVIHLLTNINGEISLPLDTLPNDSHTVTLIPGTKEKKKVTAANLSIVSNPGYFKDKKFLSVHPSLPPKILPSTQDDFRFSCGDSLIEIPEVTIKSSPKIKVNYQNIYEDRYKYANIKSSDPKLIHNSWDLENAIRNLIPTGTITNDAVYIRGGGGGTSFFGKVVGALIVLDGMPLYSNGWQIAKTFSISEIASVTVLKGKQGVTIYGLEAGGGVIFINTILHDPTLNNVYTKWESQNKNSNLLLPFKIYRSNIEFYNPSKFDIDNDPEIQKGSTYYWNPEVYFTGKEPVKVKYLNLKHTGPVMITINGASVNNLVGTARASYLVK
jgi:MG2 domain/TonB-dependent Receptor Plug Domain